MVRNHFDADHLESVFIREFAAIVPSCHSPLRVVIDKLAK